MCFGGGNDDDQEASQKNRDIEKMIRADEKKAAREVKLLLLGKPANQHPNQRPESDNHLRNCRVAWW